MKYILIDNDNYDGCTKLKQLGKVIRFYTKKQIKKMYPNKNYKVVGEIGNKEGYKISTAYTIDGTEINVYSKGSHNKLFEKCIGYIEIEDNIFLALVGSILHT